MHPFLDALNIPIWTLTVETSNLFLSLFVKISVSVANAIRRYFLVYSTLEILTAPPPFQLLKY